MAASSGLRENVYPTIFLAKMSVQIILLHYCCIGTDGKANDQRCSLSPSQA